MAPSSLDHYSKRFRLSDGLCMEDENHSIAHYEARVKDGQVQLKA